MSSDFVCKECSWRSEVVIAIFQLKMSASYTHDGKDFRQHSLRVTGYTLNEDMDTALTVCPNCENSGTVVECYDQVFICRNCGKDVDDKGGFCSYNSGTYCSICYKKFRSSCEGCGVSDACELRIANLSKANRLKESLRAKDVPKSELEMDDGISAILDFGEAVQSSEVPDRPTRQRGARDMSSFTTTNSAGNSWNMPMPIISEASDDEGVEVDDDG